MLDEHKKYKLKEEFINSDQTIEEFHDAISKEQYDEMREEAQLPLTSAILSRSKETTNVTIMSVGGSGVDIEIRLMLTKAEVELHNKFFKAMNNIATVDEDYYYGVAAKFLGLICIDDSLDEAFWIREDIDPYIVQKLISEFIKGYK